MNLDRTSLSGLAAAKFRDGSTPEVIDVVRVAANVFAAGQETSVRLLASALQRLAEDPVLAEALRADRARIPGFVEEMLRFESPVKGDFRLARVATTIGGVPIPAGTTVMVLNSAANRDPRKFDHPSDFDPERPERPPQPHLRPRGPRLSRSAARPDRGPHQRERLLERMSDIGISERVHGPAGDRNYSYVPTYILRGLSHLQLEFTPATGSPQR